MELKYVENDALCMLQISQNKGSAMSNFSLHLFLIVLNKQTIGRCHKPACYQTYH